MCWSILPASDLRRCKVFCGLRQFSVCRCLLVVLGAKWVLLGLRCVIVPSSGWQNSPLRSSWIRWIRPVKVVLTLVVGLACTLTECVMTCNLGL